MDRWSLYERCVQSPVDLCDLLVAAHAGAPSLLLEDFAGSAALSREWTRRGGSAVALDLDAEALARAGEHARCVVGDVRAAQLLAGRSFDVVHAGNFSVGYLKERRELLEYLRTRRAALRAGGVFCCDTYGGATAFERGFWQRERLVDGLRIVSNWEHRAADPVTASVENVLHFRVERDGELVAEVNEAFVYRWRLWGLAELRDVLLEAGFRTVDVFADASGPLCDGAKLGADYSVLVVGRA